MIELISIQNINKEPSLEPTRDSGLTIITSEIYALFCK